MRRIRRDSVYESAIAFRFVFSRKIVTGYDEAKCLWTSQIHRIHPNMPAATMMGIGLMWDFQKRIVHAAVIT
jgi:hypothetical protein